MANQPTSSFDWPALPRAHLSLTNRWTYGETPAIPDEGWASSEQFVLRIAFPCGKIELNVRPVKPKLGDAGPFQYAIVIGPYAGPPRGPVDLGS